MFFWLNRAIIFTMDMDFNESGEKPRFITKKREGQGANGSRVYDISMFKPYKGGQGEYDQIGTYEVVDESEAAAITEKKLLNLIKLLSGKKSLDDLSNLTDTRLLFTIVNKKEESDPSVINFRTYDGNGVSTENAVLILEKGVLND